MKNALTLLFYLAFSTFCLGQEFNLTLGKKSKVKEKEYIVGQSFSDGDAFYIYNYKAKMFSELPFASKKLKLFTRKFDSSNNPTSKTRLGVSKKNMVDWGIKYKDGQLYWLTTKFSKSDKQISFYFQIMNTDGKIKEVRKVASLSQRNKYERSIVGWDFSDDMSKIIIVAESSKLNIDELESLFKVEYKDKVYEADVITLDSDLNLISKANYQPGSHFLYNTVVDWLVSNDGHAFVAVKHYEEKLAFHSQRHFPFEDDIDNNVQLFSLPLGAKAFQKLDSISNDKIIKSIKLAQKDKNTIVIAGYSGKSKTPKANYVFISEFDTKSKALSTKKVLDLPVEVLKQLNAISKNDNGLSNYAHIKGIEFFNDGSFAFIGETSFKSSNTINPFAKNDSRGPLFLYNADDKIILIFDNDYKLKDSYVIPIRYNSEDKYNAGFVAINTGSNLLLLYHDNLKAVKKGTYMKKDGIYSRGFTAYTPTIASFTEGEINRKFLIEDKDRTLAGISLNILSSLVLDAKNTYLVFHYPVGFQYKSVKVASFEYTEQVKLNN